ncbi:MAG: hypothetical protein RIC85_04855 [Gammaproteobacteria bacterium]
MEHLDDVGASRERLQALSSRAIQIQKVREIVDTTNSTRATMKRAKVTLRDRPSASKKLINKSRQVTESFKEDWEKALGDRTLVTNFIDPAREHLAKNVTQALKEDWRKFVDETSPQIPQDWLNSLPDGGELGQAKNDIVDCLQDIQALRADLPADETSIATVSDLSEKARTIFESLDGIPESVRSFLRSASGRGARLNELTDEVRAWLSEHEMIDQVRIRFG